MPSGKRGLAGLALSAVLGISSMFSSGCKSYERVISSPADSIAYDILDGKYSPAKESTPEYRVLSWNSENREEIPQKTLEDYEALRKELFSSPEQIQELLRQQQAQERVFSSTETSYNQGEVTKGKAKEIALRITAREIHDGLGTLVDFGADVVNTLRNLPKGEIGGFRFKFDIDNDSYAIDSVGLKIHRDLGGKWRFFIEANKYLGDKIGSGSSFIPSRDYAWTNFSLADSFRRQDNLFLYFQKNF